MKTSTCIPGTTTGLPLYHSSLSQAIFWVVPVGVDFNHGFNLVNRYWLIAGYIAIYWNVESSNSVYNWCRNSGYMLPADQSIAETVVHTHLLCIRHCCSLGAAFLCLLIRRLFWPLLVLSQCWRSKRSWSEMWIVGLLLKTRRCHFRPNYCSST